MGDDRRGVDAVSVKSVNATGDGQVTAKPVDAFAGVHSMHLAKLNKFSGGDRRRSYMPKSTKGSVWAAPANGTRTASSEILHGVRYRRDLQTKAEEEERKRKAIEANTAAIKAAQQNKPSDSRRRLINRFIRESIRCQTS